MRASLMDLLVSLIFALVLIFTLVEVVQEFWHGWSPRGGRGARRPWRTPPFKARLRFPPRPA